MDRKSSLTREFQCVIVGDGGVGKTSLLMSYTTGGIMMDYIPTCFDCYTVDMKLKDRTHTMSLIDTAGQETYDRLRTLSYYSTDVFVVCFSVADEDSFENVKAKWIPEIKQYRPNTPFILVGTQSDLRNDKSEDPNCDHCRSCDTKAKTGLDCSCVTSHGVTSNLQSEESDMVPSFSSTDPKVPHGICLTNQRTRVAKCVSQRKGKSAARKLEAERYLECSALEGQGVEDVFTSALQTAIRPRRTRKSVFKTLFSVFRERKAQTS